MVKKKVTAKKGKVSGRVEKKSSPARSKISAPKKVAKKTTDLKSKSKISSLSSKRPKTTQAPVVKSKTAAPTIKKKVTKTPALSAPKKAKKTTKPTVRNMVMRKKATVSSDIKNKLSLKKAPQEIIEEREELNVAIKNVTPSISKESEAMTVNSKIDNKKPKNKVSTTHENPKLITQKSQESKENISKEKFPPSLVERFFEKKLDITCTSEIHKATSKETSSKEQSKGEVDDAIAPVKDPSQKQNLTSVDVPKELLNKKVKKEKEKSLLKGPQEEKEHEMLEVSPTSNFSDDDDDDDKDDKDLDKDLESRSIDFGHEGDIDIDLDNLESEENPNDPDALMKKEIRELGEKIIEEIEGLREDYDITEIRAALKELDLMQTTETDECQEKFCENLQQVAGYCRLHYIKNWVSVKRKERILKEGKLQQYITELVNKYPMKYIETIMNDLSSDKQFYDILKDLNIENNYVYDDVAEDAEDDDLDIETKVFGGGRSSFDEEDAI